MEYGNHRKHSAGARNVKARAKRALLLPSSRYCPYSLYGRLPTYAVLQKFAENQSYEYDDYKTFDI